MEFLNTRLKQILNLPLIKKKKHIHTTTIDHPQGSDAENSITFPIAILDDRIKHFQILGIYIN